ncbi:hypothetical protein J1N51_01990 [Psychrosphaera ytuae]|uniref:Uncharacterized protein n=1 Tax=Psychrosphaera ytuae TaxID=2820710 RepID=A0A975DC81_9GAMM|nr:hypothetical protein [Psychrosphaera ytuae]QTH64279.1 hypothetical protein J1N51_01990 [Psychrosphaera ytuae]
MRTNIHQTSQSTHDQAFAAEVNKNVITEASVYSGVARSARENDKPSFDLLLAMATQDATQFDEFKQIDTPNMFKDVLMNDVFYVKKCPIYGVADPERSLSLNKMVKDDQFKNAQLSLLMDQPPLVEGKQKVAADVFYNLGYNEQILNHDLSRALVVETDSSQSNENSSADINSKKANIHSFERPNSMDIQKWFNTIAEARSLDLVS